MNFERRCSKLGGNHYQPHPGTQCHRCGCSLPGLTRLTVNRCEGTGRVAITRAPAMWCAAIVLIYDADASRSNARISGGADEYAEKQYKLTRIEKE